MFKLTNDKGISLPIAVWLAHDSYDYDDRPNVISMTSLLKPTRMIVLSRRILGEGKVVDVEKLIASSMGTAIHDSVELAWRDKDDAKKAMKRLGFKNPDAIYDQITFEKRSEMSFGRWIVSGKFDIAFAGFPMDIKSTTVWGYIMDSNSFEHKFQLSGYKLLNPDIIYKDVGYIEYLFTDWSKKDARARPREYPQSKYQQKEVELFSNDEMKELIEQKLEEIDSQIDLDEKDLIRCTPDELWQKPDTWKYYSKPTNKRATKNFTNESDAYAMLSAKGNVGKVEFVAGEVKRCEYCPCVDICSQYKELKEKGLINE